MIRKSLLKLSSYILVSVIILALSPVRTLGWGTRGHQVIARIATARLSTSARQEIAELLSPGETLESVSNWADLKTQPSETKSWHFVAIPLKDSYYAPSKDCGKGETCVIEAIGKQMRILRDAKNDSAARAEALKFLVHLIGDLHQPFRVTTNTNPQDRGASMVRVKTLAGRSTNLRQVWDTELVDYGLRQSNVITYSTLLNNRFRRGSASQSISTQGSVTDWALETHKLPWSAYYHTNGDFMVADRKREEWPLDQVYYDKNVPLVEVQLVRAGARLAKVLNDVFGAPQAVR